MAVRYTEFNFNKNWHLFPKVVSAIERCTLFLSAIKRFFYETLTIISSVLRKSVRYREVSAIKHVRYREVPLYFPNAHWITYSMDSDLGRISHDGKKRAVRNTPIYLRTALYTTVYPFLHDVNSNHWQVCNHCTC